MKIQKKAIDLTDLALGIIILGVVVSIGATILITQRDSRLTDLPVITTHNETLTTVTETGEVLANRWVKSVDTCSNATGGEVMQSGNYTITISSLDGGGTVSAAAVQYNNTDWNCTYQWYNISQPDWALANDASIGLAEYGDWFKIIVIVGVAAVVLALIFMSFGKNAGRSEAIGGSY